jgi:hypothetical protein
MCGTFPVKWMAGQLISDWFDPAVSMPVNFHATQQVWQEFAEPLLLSSAEDKFG